MSRNKYPVKSCENLDRGNGHGKSQIFSLICIQIIVTDMVVSEIVQKLISCEKLRESSPWKLSWKIAYLVMESHGKVMEFHFLGFMGTLTWDNCNTHRAKTEPRQQEPWEGRKEDRGLEWHSRVGPVDALIPRSLWGHTPIL